MSEANPALRVTGSASSPLSPGCCGPPRSQHEERGGKAYGTFFLDGHMLGAGGGLTRRHLEGFSETFLCPLSAPDPSREVRSHVLSPRLLDRPPPATFRCGPISAPAGLGFGICGAHTPALPFMRPTPARGSAHTFHVGQTPGTASGNSPAHSGPTPTTSGTSGPRGPHAHHPALEGVKLLPSTPKLLPLTLSTTRARSHNCPGTNPQSISSHTPGHKASSRSGPVEANTSGLEGRA